MSNPTAPAEHLLLLVGGFTRHNDALTRLQLTGSSPAIRIVYARVRQLAHLATDAADHPLDAVDILDDTRTGIPVQGEGPLLTSQQSLGDAGSRLTVVRDLTALCAPMP
ncbi:hypothetical protein [Streptomyces sp. DSM 118878]